MCILTDSNHGRFHRCLADWFEKAKRPLPWRSRPGLYETVVSEFMAQQTRIETMLPYYERWLSVFPGFRALAEASEALVLKNWEGLGYYSRARNLHRLAKQMVSMGEPPKTPVEWERLPGVGPYIAAAVSSIAQDYPVPVVDGNVVRVFSRMTGERREFSSATEAVRFIRPIAERLLDHAHPGRHNQSVMELGALVCNAGMPRCVQCPVREFCAVAGRSDAAELPVIRRPVVEKIRQSRVWCLRDGAILLHRIPDDARRLAGQYELPLAGQLDWTPEGRPAMSRQRSITHYRIREDIHELPEAVPIPFMQAECLFWLPLDELESITLSGPHRRWIDELLSAEGYKTNTRQQKS